MGQMEVKPPAAAARAPVSMVSACSNPGSRRCTCMSMKPGATTRPVASNTCALGADRPGPTPLTSPSSSHTSATPSCPDAGSITRPFLMSSVGMSLSDQYAFQDCHSHGDSVLHLIQDGRALRIRHFRRNLPPAVDGAGMHDDRVRLGAFHVLRPQPIKREVFARREGGFVLP